MPVGYILMLNTLLFVMPNITLMNTSLYSLLMIINLTKALQVTAADCFLYYLIQQNQKHLSLKGEKKI